MLDGDGMALAAGGAAMALHEPEGELRVAAGCGAIAPAAGGAAIAKEPEGDARVGGDGIARAGAPFGDPWGGGVRLHEFDGAGRVGGEPGSAAWTGAIANGSAAAAGDAKGSAAAGGDAKGSGAGCAAGAAGGGASAKV
jgi:hypothetical protein